MLFVKGHPVYSVFLIISETMQPLCSTLTSDFSLTPLPVSLWTVSLSPQGRGVAQECTTTALQAPEPSGNGLFLYTTFIYTHARASPGPCKAASSRQFLTEMKSESFHQPPGNFCYQPQKHKSFPLCYLTFIYIYGLLNLTLTQLLEPMLRGVKGAFGLPATQHPFPFHETSILCAHLTTWGFTRGPCLSTAVAMPRVGAVLQFPASMHVPSPHPPLPLSVTA